MTPRSTLTGPRTTPSRPLHLAASHPPHPPPSVRIHLWRWRARRYNLFSDPEIITLPSSLGWLNGPIAKIISKTRAPTSREGYAAIGGGSPQLSTTIKQGEALEAAMLNLHGVKAGQPVEDGYSLATSGCSLGYMDLQLWRPQRRAGAACLGPPPLSPGCATLWGRAADPLRAHWWGRLRCGPA